MSLCLVTGSYGFIGSNLVKHLLGLGRTVVALGKGISNSEDIECIRNNESRLLIPIFGSILDQSLIREIFKTYKFDTVYHLAGQSSPPLSWSQPLQTMEINFNGSVNILSGAIEAARTPSIVLVSSSAIYAPQKNATPIKESAECKPVTPYGVSKLAMDQLASIYTAVYGMRVISARPFFIIGPGKLNDVCSDWARNIVRIERGELNWLPVGLIEGIARDFLSVSDAVSALITISEKGVSGEAYNICSGEAVSLSNILEILKNDTRTTIVTRIDDSKTRPIEESIKVGNNDKLSSLGWTRKDNIKQTIVDILNYWRLKM